MPRTRSLAWSELKIGALAVAALGLAILVIVAVGNQGGFFWERYELRTSFDNVEGLKEGAVVRVAGVEVGSVTGIRFDGASVQVVMELADGMQPRVTEGSRATIGALSLLGEPVIDITASTVGSSLPDGGFIRSTRPAAGLTEVAESATGTLARVQEVVDDVRAGRGTVGRLFTDDALYQQLQAFAASGAELTEGLSRGRGTIGRLLNEPALARSLESSMGHLDVVLERVRAGEGSLGRLVQDEAFATSLAATTQNFDLLSDRLNRGEGTAGKLLTDSEVYDRLNSVLARLSDLTARLDRGEGTMGQLLRDGQLYENMNETVGEMRRLLGDVREDPKKFLTVRVSIF